MAASPAAVTAAKEKQRSMMEEQQAITTGADPVEAGVEAVDAKTALAGGEGVTAVAPHGDEAHTGGEATATAVAPKPKKKRKLWGGIGKALTGGLSGLFYKMPAAGKYNNSPIEKNYGSPEQRGFTPLNKLKTFGVGSLEKTGGVGASMEPPLKLMGLVKKKVNKELETPAGQMASKAFMGGI